MRPLVLVLPILLASVALAQAPSTFAAPTAAADTRVTAALDAAGLTYHVMEDGVVVFTYTGLGDAAAREQMVEISSETMLYGDREMREIWSVARDDASPVSSKLVVRLMEENGNVSLGAWAMEGNVVFFRATLPADASPADLALFTEGVASTADSLEAELSETDDL